MTKCKMEGDTMGSMEEWMTRFLSSQESFSTKKQKDDALLAFVEFEGLGDREAYQDIDKVHELCRRIDQYVTHARPRAVVNKDQHMILDPFFSKLLDFTVSLALLNANTHAFIRDDTSILASLTSYLNGKYQQQDRAKILKTIEVFSRGIVVSWSMPYLGQLVKQIFTIFLDTKLPETNLYVLRILSNLIFNNPNGVNMVLREANYRDFLKRVFSLLDENDQDNKGGLQELKTMALNFVFLTDPAISLQMSLQITNIRQTFNYIQSKMEIENFKNVQDIGTTIYYMTVCVSTMLTLCLQKYKESDQVNGNEKLDLNRAVNKVVREISACVFSKFFTKLIPLLREDNGQLVVASLLNLMKALCPATVPVEEYDNMWDEFAKSLNELSMVASPKSSAQITVLETHLHFLERMSKSTKKSALSVEAFKYALTHCQILVSSHPVDLTRNILTIRLLNRLHSLANAQNRKDGSDPLNKVSKLLNEETLSKLLYELLSEKTEDYSCLAPCIQMSTCVVEILNVISKMSKNATAVLESVAKEKTWFHIANCIVNGNEELIAQALALLSSVGFSAKCRMGVAKTLMEMRGTGTPLASLPASPERSACVSINAIGVKRLNDNLQVFEQNLVSGNDQAIDDVFAWYKLKNDMHEMELANMNDHIFHLNRTISHLKTLINKQSDLIAKRALSNATMTKSHNDLKQQLEVTKEKKSELEVKHLKAIQSLRTQLAYQEEQHNNKRDALAILQQEYNELKQSHDVLKINRDETQETNRQVNAEKRKLQDKLEEVEKEFKCSREKISNLESNLKKSEEARKSAEALLEAERRKTEIIQQVLGNRLS